MDIRELLPGIKKNVLLRDYTTFRIGGPAKYFYIAKTKEDIIKAVLAAKKYNLPFFILGGGSNLLVSDKEFNGMIIKMKNEKLKTKNYNLKFKIFCESEVPLAKLVSKSLEIGASGLEWAMGIPGTVGGAIAGNAGAFGKSMADITKTVTILKCDEIGSPQEIRSLKNKDCKFGYRDSIFKKNKKLIILSATLQLKKGNKKEIQKKIKEYLNYRKKTHPLNFPSTGSVFKNYESRIVNYKLVKEFPELKEFNKRGQIPAAWLIEKCGLKGKRIGNVKISEKHANFIVNLGNGKAKDVIKLIKLTKKKVKNRFKINLDEEICYLGFKN